MTAMTKFEFNLGLVEPLRTLVTRSFQAAKRSETLVFSDTELSVIKSRHGAPFQLRYCPALAKKPVASRSDKEEAQRKPIPDPFENPPAELVIAEIPRASPSHILVLNKYPVIPNHFILATKVSKPQTNLLEKDDLGMTYACLEAWADHSGAHPNGKLFAFFNSGDHSGASQVHRHLQFLPVEDMIGDRNDGWQLLLERMTHRSHAQLPLDRDPALPFVQFATLLGPNVQPDSLYVKYEMLLRAAVNAVQHSDKSLCGDETILFEENGQPIISYNLAMTTDIMAICPRSSESASVPIESVKSSIAINGTVLGGTLMVKDQREWDTLRQNPALLDDMLLSIGYPAVKGPETKDGTATKL